MKLKRLGILIILLVVSICIAIIYFGMNNSYRNSNIGITTEPYYEDIDSDSYNPNGIQDNLWVESTTESILRNIKLVSPNQRVSYSLVMQDYVDKETSTNKFFVYNHVIADKEMLDDNKFYSLEIRTEANSLIHKLQNMNNGNIYEEVIAEYWILNNEVTENKIASLITTKDPELKSQNGCTVVETTNTATGDRNTDSINFEGKAYQIVFKPENLSAEVLNKYSNQSLNGICGKYGPVNDSYGSLSQGNFFYENGVLIFLPVDSMWHWSFQQNNAKIINRLN